MACRRQLVGALRSQSLAMAPTLVADGSVGSDADGERGDVPLVTEPDIDAIWWMPPSSPNTMSERQRRLLQVATLCS